MGMFVVAPASSFHHHHHDAVISADTAVGSTTAATTLGVGVGVGVFPLLTTAPCLNVAADEGDQNMLSGRSRGGIQLWQNQLNNSQHLKKPAILDHGNISPTLLHGGGISGGAAVSTSSTATCQDCGNQSKKDCSYRRCRTCCKSRGFDCATHVRSTWVPASRRRERQLMNPAPAAAGGSGSSTSTSAGGVKKPRLVPSQTTTTNSHTSTSNTTPPRSFDTSSSRQDASFRESLPGQVRAPAVFKCVRVTAVEGGEDEYAYQAVVKIGGHVFKGFLYDQGVESRQGGFPNMSELHLGSGERHGASSSSQMLDPSDLYNAASGGRLPGGSNYGNNPIN